MLTAPNTFVQVAADCNVAVVEFYRSIGYKIEERTSLGKRLDTPQRPGP